MTVSQPILPSTPSTILYQAMCLLTCNGSTDPWLENPHDLHRGNTLVTDLRYLPTYLHTYIPTYLLLLGGRDLRYIGTYIPTYLPTYLHTYLLTYLPTYLPTYSSLVDVTSGT